MTTAEFILIVLTGKVNLKKGNCDNLNKFPIYAHNFNRIILSGAQHMDFDSLFL